MLTFVAIVHILFAFTLIALVLLQDPKGGGSGIFGGGGGANTLMGATGQTTFFSRLTKWSAVIFGTTCLTMTIITRQDAGSVIDANALPVSAPLSSPAAVPVAPESVPQAPGSMPQAPGSMPKAPDAAPQAPAAGAPAQAPATPVSH